MARLLAESMGTIAPSVAPRFRVNGVPSPRSMNGAAYRAPTWAEIDLDAVEANVRALRAHIGPSVGLLAVVKANAYGHGAIPVAQAALAAGAAGLAVGRLDEAIELRGAGIVAPILMMGPVLAGDARRCVELDLTPTVNDLEVARALDREARAAGLRLPVHIKVDTGLARFGLLAHEAVEFACTIAALGGVEIEGLYTHFAAADAADLAYTHRQLAIFRDVVRQVRAGGVRPRLLHAANSAATLCVPASHFDLVRVGAALYGLQPIAPASHPVTLQPALALKTTVIRLRRVPAGTAVSYGCTYRTPAATNLATLAAGYGDGYAAALSNRGAALIRGQCRPVVGRVCMDQLVVDCGDGSDVQEGDVAVLIGRQGDAVITAEDVATAGGTINYEVVTALSARVPRRYRRSGQVVAVRLLTGTMQPVAD